MELLTIEKLTLNFLVVLALVTSVSFPLLRTRRGITEMLPVFNEAAAFTLMLSSSFAFSRSLALVDTESTVVRSVFRSLVKA